MKHVERVAAAALALAALFALPALPSFASDTGGESSAASSAANAAIAAAMKDGTVTGLPCAGQPGAPRRARVHPGAAPAGSLAPALAPSPR